MYDHRVEGLVRSMGGSGLSCGFWALIDCIEAVRDGVQVHTALAAAAAKEGITVPTLRRRIRTLIDRMHRLGLEHYHLFWQSARKPKPEELIELAARSLPN